MIKTYCDMCEVEIMTKMWCVSLGRPKKDIDYDFDDYDLCDKCFTEVKERVTGERPKRS